MSKKSPQTNRTVAVIFGASEFPRNSLWEPRESFERSAQAIEHYCTSGRGLRMKPDNVLNLFNDARDPMTQLEEIEEFLLSFSDDDEPNRPENLLIYYVGHGCFADDQKHCFALKCTKRDQYGRSAIRGSDLVGILRQSAPFLRSFIILDCCFAAQLYREFQSTPGQAFENQFEEELPTRGTALLCASGRDSASVARENWHYTMFTGALMQVLGSGHKSLDTRLSLRQIQKLCVQELRRRFPDDFVRPEIHAPNAEEGDVAELPFFPNTAKADDGDEYLGPSDLVLKDGHWKVAGGEWKPVTSHIETVKFTLPAIRGLMTGFKLTEWHQDLFAVIRVGDPLFTVKGHGIEATVTASDAGILLQKAFEEGQSLNADEVVGLIAPVPE